MPMKENRLMAKFDITLCYNEVEWKKIEQVQIPLPNAASSLSDAKKMKKKNCPDGHTIAKLDNYKKSTFSPQKIRPWSCPSGSDIG